ncbi:MAG: hypothetical protein ABIP48_03100, partial [Planctomycetota bacterium]
TLRGTLGWLGRLTRGKIQRHDAPPTSRLPMRNVDGSPADHALPGTPTSTAPADSRLRIVRKKSA